MTKNRPTSGLGRRARRLSKRLTPRQEGATGAANADNEFSLFHRHAMTFRRALLGAIDQAEAMIAIAGTDPAFWHDGIGLVGAGTPLANDAGIEIMRGRRDYAGVRQALARAGYNGERIVVLAPTDAPAYRYYVSRPLITKDQADRSAGRRIRAQAAVISVKAFDPALPVIEEVRFARDSPLEGRGFEPSVPLRTERSSARARSSLPPAHRRQNGSLMTLRWREMDSNFRFRTREATDLSFRFLSMSLKLSAF
jgi:hypothetical protein